MQLTKRGGFVGVQGGLIFIESRFAADPRCSAAGHRCRRSKRTAMKFFTREYWLGLQRRDYTPPPPDMDPFTLYRAELEALRGRVNVEAFDFFAEADVHDGELLGLAVIDGNRPAPL